jgi:hypothetical protein
MSCGTMIGGRRDGGKVISFVNRQILIAHVEAARPTTETVRVNAGVVTKRHHLLVTSVGFVGLFHGR